MDVPTSEGLARVHLDAPPSPRALLALGHAAGGSVDAPDLLAAAGAARAAGIAVARVEQPYRVAGSRRAAPAARLDAAWTEVMAAIAGPPLIAGGRSSGARVACRTAAATGAIGVLCLAFPLVPPWAPDKPRGAELEGVAVPVLVVQGDRDRFGMPSPGPDRTVVTVRGDHGLRRDPRAVAAAVGEWLERLLAQIGQETPVPPMPQ